MDRRTFLLLTTGGMAGCAAPLRMTPTKPLFKPTTDLHHHMDAMSPRAIKLVSDRHDLPWAGKSLAEITGLAQVKPGVSWETWYKAHSQARAAVFTKPEVFAEVGKQAVIDAEEEKLDVRVLRFSLSMPEYCFRAQHQNTKPNLGQKSDRREFLEFLDQVMGYLIQGVKGYQSKVKTPLVFSISGQTKYVLLLDDVANIALNHKKHLSGTDITNEQVDCLATRYLNTIKKLRAGGIEALTVHTGEQEAAPGEQYSAKERILATLKLDPNLIAHAIYAAKHPDCIRQMAQSGAVLELCPSANIFLNQEFVDDILTVDSEVDLKRYPLLTFEEAGLPCTINTDVPGSIGSTLQNEFHLIQGIYDLPNSHLRKLDRRARETARKVYKV